MRKILLLIISILFIGCTTRKSNVYKNEDKSSRSENIQRSRSSDIKSGRYQADYSKTVSGKMNLSITPGSLTKQDSVSTKKPRKLKVKDAAGNTAVYDLRGNETVNFGTEHKEKTDLKILQDSMKIFQNNFEELKKDFSNYKKENSKETERSGMPFGNVLIIVIAIAIVVIIILKK